MNLNLIRKKHEFSMNRRRGGASSWRRWGEKKNNEAKKLKNFVDNGGLPFLLEEIENQANLSLAIFSLSTIATTDLFHSEIISRGTIPIVVPLTRHDDPVVACEAFKIVSLLSRNGLRGGAHG